MNEQAGSQGTLIIAERIGDDGAPVRTTLRIVDAALRLGGDGEESVLPLSAIDHVMARYGRPLAEDVVLRGPALDAGHGRSFHMLRHLARYDVIARDFFVLVRPGAEPLAELATTVAAALAHLARAHAR